MSMENLYSSKRFRSALRAFLLGRAAQGVVSFLITLWLVRLLAPNDYGAYMALWGLTEMLVPLSSLGLLEAVRRFLPELAARGSAAGVRSLVRWTTLARAFILLAWGLGAFLGWNTLAGWIGLSPEQFGQTPQAVLLALLVVAFRYACEMLECLLEQQWSQIVHAMHPAGRLIGLVGLFLLDAVSLELLLWLDVIVSVICLLLAELALMRKLASLPNLGGYSVSAREFTGYAWHLAGVNLFQSVACAGAQRLLVARLLGLDTAGLFAFLQQLLSIVSRYMPAQLLANIIRPVLISRLATGEYRAVSRAIALMWKTNLIIVSGSVVITLVAGDAIVSLLSSGRFNDAGIPALLLFVGLGAVSQGRVVNMAMQIHDKTSALRKQSCLFLLLPIAAWLGSFHGLMGLMVGIVLTHWFRNVVAMWWMRRQGIGVEFDRMGVARILVVSVLVGGLGFGVAQTYGPWVAFTITLFLLIACMILVRPLSHSDHVLLLSVLKGRARFLKPLVWLGQ